jgi:hypothetical protein
MARLVGTLTLETRGLDQCKASLESIGEAAQNAYLDLENIDVAEGGALTFNGMAVTRMETSWEGFHGVLAIKPTAGMHLFVAWLMANLPATATVAWRDGWPLVYCPPNDDGDFEDDPTPLMPNELELA